MEHLLGLAALNYRATEGLNMSQPKKTKGSKLMAQKKKLQREFLQQAKTEGLSSAQTVERASIFPKGARLKVVKWPKF
ncbi:MAG: hypothetical protein KGL40_02175 [Rhodocyclaceae bacterium]|nr:hypothetical protein [Rhodocyclaceae bacterium]